MTFLPALLHAAALTIALFIQTMDGPLAGAWLFYHLAACGVLLAGGYPKEKGPVWWASLVWLVALGITTFFLTPVKGGASVMWTLSALPVMALCLRREHFAPYAWCFGIVLACYATGLIVQTILGVQYTRFNYPGRAWPLINPNNAAAVINAGLIPAFYLALRNPKWLVLTALFAVALYATRSVAGGCVALAACMILLVDRYGRGVLDLAVIAGIPAMLAGMAVWPGVFERAAASFLMRFPIWEASLPLLDIRPLWGLGFGMFGFYYAQVRTETGTSGYFAHNDILQFAIEAGIPAAVVFCGLIAAVLFATRRTNLAAACVVMAVTLQAMVEFQFYVPAISLLTGLALAAHRITQTKELT